MIGPRSRRAARRALLLALLAAGAARAQSSVVLGTTDPAYSIQGGGARTVLFRSGWYFAFFWDGSTLVYAASRDGSVFTAPVRAIPATSPLLGFSVANLGDRVALVWAQENAPSGLWYREGTTSGAAISWGGAHLVRAGASPSSVSFPMVVFDALGNPVVDALEEDPPYAGPLPGPCADAGFRPSPHVGSRTAPDGGLDFSTIGYCAESVPSFGVSSVSLVATGTPEVVHAALMNGKLVTGLIDGRFPGGAAEQGEPELRSDAMYWSETGQLSSAGDPVVPTDVHHVYTNGSLGIGYARQDATRDAGSGLGFDVATIAPLGRSPYLAEPPAGGCHTVAWVDGSAIWVRHFRGAVDGGQGLSAPVKAFTTTNQPAYLTGQASAAGEPAVTWQDGSQIRFGILPASPVAPTLTATPASGWADGVSPVTVTGSFTDSCGAPLPAGARATVVSWFGTIAEPDLDPATPGVQLETDGGTVSFTLRSAASGTGQVTVLPAGGGRAATIPVRFDSLSRQLAFTTPPAPQLQAGACTPPLTVELEDSSGAATPYPSDLVLSLEGSSLEFHDASGCSGPPISQVVLPAGATAASFSLVARVASAAQAVTVRTSMPPGASALQWVQVLAGPPSAVGMASSPFTILPGECSPAVVFEVQDAYGNALTLPADAAFTASANGPTARLFSDEGCATPLVGPIVARSSGSFHATAEVPGPFELSVEADGLDGGSQVETVDPSGVDLELTVDPESGTDIALGGGRFFPAFISSPLSPSSPVVALAQTSAVPIRTRLRLDVAAGAAFSPPATTVLVTGGSVSPMQFRAVGTVTGAVGEELIVTGQLETSGGVLFGPEVTFRKTIGPTVVEIGGCGGCGAGGGDLAGGAAALALLALLGAGRSGRELTRRRWRWPGRAAPPPRSGSPR